MQKKLFLQKNLKLRSAGRPLYVNTLLWCAVGLILLIIVVPLVIRKDQKQAVQSPPTEKSGAVLKEIPRPLEAFPEKLPESDGMEGSAVKDGDSKSTSVADMKSFPDGSESKQPFSPSVRTDLPEPGAATQSGTETQPSAQAIPKPMTPESHELSTEKQSPAESGGILPSGKPASGANKQDQTQSSSAALKSKETSTSLEAEKKLSKKMTEESAAGASSQLQPSSVPEGQKSGETMGKVLFTVQVGSFKEKKNADDMQQSLVKRGYKVVVKSITHASLGLLYIVQLEPVNDVGKASTLVEQIKHESKVKPVILKTVSEQ
ncbi:MAG: SPOR domain-containing protein [Syntrophobacteraceae bacterium]